MNTDERPVNVLAVPAGHPYTQAVRPDGVVYTPDPDIDGHWWPHPAFTAEYWRELDAGATPDLVHVHFGFEHFSPEEIRRMVAALPVPLVLTVHDIDNPHLVDQTEHHARLRVLLDAADAVFTLTECAADALRARFGAHDVTVVPHPRITRGVAAPRGGRAAVFLKSLRSNVVADPQFYIALAERVPLDVYVHDVAATLQLRRELELAGVRVHVHEPMGDSELHAAVAAAPVCVLPYIRGTHSGWLEMCRDLGTSVAVPDIGCYAGQADIPEAIAMYRAGDGASAAAAAARLMERGPVALSVDRDAQLAQVRSVHKRTYSELTGRGQNHREGGEA